MRKNSKKKNSIAFPAVVLILAFAAIAWYWQRQPGYDIEPGILSIESAFHQQQSGLMVEVDGQVVRILEAHELRERYQEFIIRLRNGQSVHIVHDMAYADEIPLSIGDQVLVRGEYRWSENGGTISYTYRDRSMQRRHGWIDHRGDRYQ